jgi:hypothetical protein
MKPASKFVAALTLVSVPLVFAYAAEPAWLVAPLTDQQLIAGCSWTASAPTLGAGYIFMADYDDSKILMNIDGSDTSLVAVNEYIPMRDVGDMVLRTYRADGIEVQARYQATWVCPAGAEGCEVTEFDATYEVRKGARTQLVEASGALGC